LLNPVLVRNESLASVMAEVYGRLTGRPGVAIGQGDSARLPIWTTLKLPTPWAVAAFEWHNRISCPLLWPRHLDGSQPTVVDVVASFRTSFRDVTSPLTNRP